MLTKRPARAQRGVTLIELMVTLTVLGLLLFATLPSMSEWLRNLQIRNATQSVLGGMQRARTEAIKRNQNVTFSLVSLADNRVMSNSCALSSSGVSWVVSLQSPAGSCGAALSDTVAPMLIETHAAGDGSASAIVTALDSAGAAATQVTFNGFGEVVQTGNPIVRVAVSVSGTGYRALEVRLGRGGNVRMCDPLATGTDSRAC